MFSSKHISTRLKNSPDKVLIITHIENVNDFIENALLIKLIIIKYKKNKKNEFL